MVDRFQIATAKNTQFAEDISVFRWCIDLESEQQTTFESPEFKTGLDKELTWKLIFVTTLQHKRLYLKLINRQIGDMRIVARGTLRYTMKLSSTKTHIYKSNIDPTLIDVGGVFNILPDELYKFAKLAGKFEISILTSTIDNELEKQLGQTKSLILDHFETLFLQDKFSDAVLIVSGEKLHVHKNILAARSEVFKAMFDNDMKENLQNSVTVDDAESGDVKEMLRFIYCGKVDNTRSSAKNLLALAEKYALSDLKALCESTLAHGLTKSNSIETLQLASLYRAEKLQDAAIDFIMRNDIGKEIDMKQLFESDPNLALRFMHQFNLSKK